MAWLMLTVFLQVYSESSEQKAERGDVETMQLGGERCGENLKSPTKQLWR